MSLDAGVILHLSESNLTRTRICASLGLRIEFKTLFMSDFDLLLDSFLICPSNSWPWVLLFEF